MSFNKIINKLLYSMKDEINKDENIEIIKNDILEPIIKEIFYIMYPYFIGVSIIFIIIIIVIFMILFLNIKICYPN
jgi:hypothetical protein